MLGTLWGLSNAQKSGSQDRVQRRDHWHQFPCLDEMMMTNVRQFQIPRFPNDKRFQTKLCAEVVNSVSKLWVTQKDGYGVWFGGLLVPQPLPYDDQKMEPKRLVSHKTSIYLRAPLKTQDVSSFLCASS